VELGESLEAALVRELQEETGVTVRPVELLLVFDRIERAEGRVLSHYVIADYLCEYVSGTPRAGSDALEVVLADPQELGRFDLPSKALEVVQQALARAARRSRS
jgi:ADP-ribose pyrophosphatase YjhB (NUDIX family)